MAEKTYRICDMNVLNAGGTTVSIEEPPVPLAVSDFKNGTHSIGGVSKTLVEMWVSSGDWYGDWTPYYVPGVGLQKSGTGNGGEGPVSTAELWAALRPDLNGCTVVLDYTLVDSATTVCKAFVALEDLDGWLFEAYLGDQTGPMYGQGEAGAMLSVYDDQNVWGETPADALSGNPRRIAATMASGNMAFSANGHAVRIPVPMPSIAGNTGIGLGVTTFGSGAIATATIEKVTFYAPQDAANLPALSAL